jgi:DNA-binding PadR family transcriptional regulator
VPDDRIDLLYGTLDMIVVWVRSEWRRTDNNRRSRYWELTSAGEREFAKHRAEWHRTIRAVNGMLRGSGPLLR